MVQGYKDIQNAIMYLTDRIETVSNWVQGIQTHGNTNMTRIRESIARTQAPENWASRQSGYYDKLEEHICQLEIHIWYLQNIDVQGHLKFCEPVIYDNGLHMDGDWTRQAPEYAYVDNWDAQVQDDKHCDKRVSTFSGELSSDPSLGSLALDSDMYNSAPPPNQHVLGKRKCTPYPQSGV